jgi:Icc-related predicted phosphoesterase
MKILCVSDQIDPLVYSCSIKDRFADIDLVVSAGDLPLDYLGFIVTCLNKPLLFVFGNHNLEGLNYYAPGPDRPLLVRTALEEENANASGAIHIGARREGGLLFAGLGGSFVYNKGPNQFSEFGMAMAAFRLLPQLVWNRLRHGRFLDVLVTHAPPFGIHDKPDRCHRGFKFFLWFMRAFRPKFLIHGHIHLYDLKDVRTTRYGETLVVNAYSHFLVETGAPA